MSVDERECLLGLPSILSAFILEFQDGHFQVECLPKRPVEPGCAPEACLAGRQGSGSGEEKQFVDVLI